MGVTTTAPPLHAADSTATSAAKEQDVICIGIPPALSRECRFSASRRAAIKR
jgi:hypothetical protein